MTNFESDSPEETSATKDLPLPEQPNVAAGEDVVDPVSGETHDSGHPNDRERQFRKLEERVEKLIGLLERALEGRKNDQEVIIEQNKMIETLTTRLNSMEAQPNENTTSAMTVEADTANEPSELEVGEGDIKFKPGKRVKVILQGREDTPEWAEVTAKEPWRDSEGNIQVEIKLANGQVTSGPQDELEKMQDPEPEHGFYPGQKLMIVTPTGFREATVNRESPYATENNVQYVNVEEEFHGEIHRHKVKQEELIMMQIVAAKSGLRRFAYTWGEYAGYPFSHKDDMKDSFKERVGKFKSAAERRLAKHFSKEKLRKATLNFLMSAAATNNVAVIHLVPPSELYTEEQLKKRQSKALPHH